MKRLYVNANIISTIGLGIRIEESRKISQGLGLGRPRPLALLHEVWPLGILGSGSATELIVYAAGEAGEEAAAT